MLNRLKIARQIEISSKFFGKIKSFQNFFLQARERQLLCMQLQVLELFIQLQQRAVEETFPYAVVIKCTDNKIIIRIR